MDEPALGFMLGLERGTRLGFGRRGEKRVGKEKIEVISSCCYHVLERAARMHELSHPFVCCNYRAGLKTCAIGFVSR